MGRCHHSQLPHFVQQTSSPCLEVLFTFDPILPSAADSICHARISWLRIVRLLLTRFAYEESFSEYSKGGGKESNIKVIPFMVQMGVHLLRKAPASNHARVLTTLKSALSGQVNEWFSVVVRMVSVVFILFILLFVDDDRNHWRKC